VPRPRTTKKLAQRIDLNYFARPHPLRRARFLLSVAAPLLALLWLSWHALGHDREPYTAGPMASVHAVFGLKCGACHVVEAGRFRRLASDRACLACHDGPIHHADQMFTPRCRDCHVEHRGRVALAHMSGRACTRCHAHLVTRSGPSRFFADIEDFDRRHPEFAPLRPGSFDPGTIKLNHAVHLKANLRGPDGKPVQLVCSDCHRTPAENAGWRFGFAEFQKPARPARGPAAPASRDPLAPKPTRAYMSPVAYAKACAACHPLLFDKRFAEPVPHDKPEIVHAFVVHKFREYIARHPEELRAASQSEWLLPRNPLPAARPARLTPDEWVNERVAEAEQLLWQKTCQECHSLSQPGPSQSQTQPSQDPWRLLWVRASALTKGRPQQGASAPEAGSRALHNSSREQLTGPALPVVAPARVTPVWLPHAVFDHHAHQMLACASCHPKALSSQETTDVLIPGIATCRECHFRGPHAAESRCFECHIYHDWSRQKPIHGTYAISGLLRH
jgi:hypothetical protein